MVCFSCHTKGHYANACPQKAQRAATNVAGQDKPTMSREEKIFSEVHRLLNKDEEKSGMGPSFGSGYATTQDASIDGSEGKGSQSNFYS